MLKTDRDSSNKLRRLNREQRQERSMVDAARRNEPFMACVLTRDVFSVSEVEVARTLRDRFGCDVKTSPDGDKDGATSGVIIVDGIFLAVMFVPRPMPGEEELQALAPKALHRHESLAHHAEHAMVMTVGDYDGHVQSLAAALAVIKVCAALCETEPVSAVLWYLSSVFVSRDAFLEFASPEALVRNPLPLPIIVKLGGHEEAGSPAERVLRSVYGSGFRRYIGRDLEFAPKALSFEMLTNRLMNIGSWLLTEGPVLRDGESCGYSAHEVIRASYQDRGRYLSTPVLMLDIEQLDPAK